jgi:uncharacterized protein (TIGR02246 family)
MSHRRGAGISRRQADSYRKEITMIRNGLASRTDESAAAAAVIQQLYAAWADGDAGTFADLFADDATAVLPGVFNHGRSAIREYMAGMFAGPLKGSRAIGEPRDVRIIGADTAIVVSTTGVIMAGEQDLPAEREGLGTWVLSRQDGRWLVAAFADAPAPAAR